MVETLDCPNCGAPLPAQAGQAAVWVCLYCDSLVRMAAEAGQAAPAVAGQVAPEVMAEVKQLLLSGRRAEAAERYQQLAGADAEAAEQAVAALVREVSAHTIRRQQLSLFGVVVVGLSLAALLAAVAAAATGALGAGWALLLALLPAAVLLVFGPGLAISLRYLLAPRARATVQKQTYIGQIQTRYGLIHAYRLLLEVSPRPLRSAARAGRNGEPFRAEIMVPVREKSLRYLKTGTPLQVKYLPGDPASVVFDRRLESDL
jgi:hypothetical protein